ncbi:hypothetical protein DOY81_011618 [Sarcophaga bullata]|nr:hypothetical protein DOY81_011618 [Sarcophaga bullata]
MNLVFENQDRKRNVGQKQIEKIVMLEYNDQSPSHSIWLKNVSLTAKLAIKWLPPVADYSE